MAPHLLATQSPTATVGMRLLFAALTLATSTSFAEDMANSRDEVRGPEVSATNAKELGYEVRVEVPDESEPKFKRLHLKFPEFIGEFRYAYSSVVYSKDGKRILSYRPDALSTVPSSDRKELYILADQDVLPCLSFVSVYFDKKVEVDHPPRMYVSVDLASFVFDTSAKCKGKIDARNFY